MSKMSELHATLNRDEFGYPENLQIPVLTQVYVLEEYNKTTDISKLIAAYTNYADAVRNREQISEPMEKINPDVYYFINTVKVNVDL